ncbi:MAG: hypothetical protein IKX16_09010, partial [Clostridia bacterium]|nr:hypothetical protein [Clostridia bacterium]
MGKRPFRLFGILHTASKPHSLTQGRSGACSPTDLLNPKITKMEKRNPSDAAALPRRATSPDSGEADCLT